MANNFEFDSMKAKGIPCVSFFPITMNQVLINTSKMLNLKPFKSSSGTDINQIISVFKNHVSIRKIQECFPNIEANDFNFR